MKTNTLYYGDNLGILRNPDYFESKSVHLIYLDPPFNSKRDYNLIYTEKSGKPSQAQVQAFSDFWRWDNAAEFAFAEIVSGKVAPPEVVELIGALRKGLDESDVMAYLVMMTARLLELHRILRDDGSIYLHCDPAASHYLKIVMDRIFGPKHFRREIIWRSGWVSGYKAKARNWVRNHDTILYYIKTNKALQKFNKDSTYVPHREGYKRRGGGGNPKGIPLDDVWTDIYSPWIMSFSKEKLGFQTQKPLALLRRIIEASSSPDDIVLDPFAGCGTAVVAAQALGRRWIGIDITHLAVALVRERLHRAFRATFPDPRDLPVIGEPVDLAGAKALAEMKPDGRYQFQWWADGLVGARPVKKQKGPDKGVDGLRTFVSEKSGTVDAVVVQVKSGKVSVTDVRDLVGTMKRREAEMGLLITLEPPTKPMKTEAVSAGFYQAELWDKKFRRVQIATIEELLAGKLPVLPPVAPDEVMNARAIDEKAAQPELLPNPPQA